VSKPEVMKAQTIDLGSLQDLSQLLDQAVEGQGKHFDELGEGLKIDQRKSLTIDDNDGVDKISAKFKHFPREIVDG
jgi:hypothetical protein